MFPLNKLEICVLYRCDNSADYRSAMKRDTSLSLTISHYRSVVETGLYLKFGDSVDGFEWPQHSKHSQRLYGRQVLSSATRWRFAGTAIGAGTQIGTISLTASTLIYARSTVYSVWLWMNEKNRQLCYQQWMGLFTNYWQLLILRHSLVLIVNRTDMTATKSQGTAACHFLEVCLVAPIKWINWLSNYLNELQRTHNGCLSDLM